MLKFAFLLSCLLILQATPSRGRLVCPVNNQELLTDSRNLLPLDKITSSSEDSGSNPSSQIINPNSNWCSALDTVNVADEYVEMNFTEPVLVFLVLSGGYINSYVNNFSILYTLSETENDFQPYGEMKPQQDFLVPNILLSSVYFTLESPVLARRLHFSIHDGVSDAVDRICWSLRVFGCKASDAYTLDDGCDVRKPSTAPATSSSSSTAKNSPATDAGTRETTQELSSPNGCSEQSSSFVQRDLLLVVIPVAVVLVIVFLIIVVIGVIICLCCARSRQPDSPTYDTVKLKIGTNRTREIVDGTPGSAGFVYDQPRPQFYDVPKAVRSQSSTRGSTSSLGSHMDNPVYLAKRNVQELSDTLMSTDDGNDYEDVLEATAGINRHAMNDSATFRSGNIHPPNNDLVRLPPSLEDVHLPTDRTMSLDHSASVKYSRVDKGRSNDQERGRSSSPVIKSHYMSTNAAITAELNRLTSELENSLKGQ